jgi:RHS repeat-associated protein
VSLPLDIPHAVHPGALLAPGSVTTPAVSTHAIPPRPASHRAAAYALIPLLLGQGLPALPPTASAGWAVKQGPDEKGRVASCKCVAVVGLSVLESPHPQTPSPFIDGSRRGGSGNGPRITAELVRMPSSPSAPSGIRPLGYNTLNRLTNLATQKAATIIQSYAFTLGPTGNRTQIAEVGKTKTYTYDDLYRLTGETLSGGTVYSKVFGYDPVGNRQAQTTTGTAGAIVTPGTINYGYDIRDRLLTENATNYGYDANGNLTTQSGFGTYTFDTENRLVRIAKQDGTVIEHAYDADGTRIRTRTTPATGPPQTTNFLVDTSGGLSHVVAESDATNTQTAYYLRALDDLLALIRPTGTKYYHADGIGSVRKLSDETGTVTDTYEYTAFGEQYEHVGTDPQPYSFAGEPLDPSTGFQYHRARWMQTSTGRFVAMDPAVAALGDLRNSHRYLYAGGGPGDSADPTGLAIEPIQLAIGKAAHKLISLYYEGINGFVDTSVKNGFRARTDIRFHADASTAGGRVLFPGTAGEVYEIKSRARLLEGREDLRFYVDILNQSFPGIDWRPGVAIAPIPTSWPGVLVHPSLANTTMRVGLEPPGVIVYWFEGGAKEDPEERYGYELVMTLLVLSARVQQLQQAQISTQVNLSISLGGRF